MTKLEVIFIMFTNIAIGVGSKFFSYMLLREEDFAKEIDLWRDFKFLANNQYLIMLICILHSLMTALLVLPSTRCMQRNLNPCIKKQYVIYQVVSAMLLYSTAFYIDKRCKSVLVIFKQLLDGEDTSLSNYFIAKVHWLNAFHQLIQSLCVFRIVATFGMAIIITPNLEELETLSQH